MTEPPHPDTVAQVGWISQSGPAPMDGWLFHAVADGKRSPCGKELDEVVDRDRLASDARPCCRCFHLTRDRSVAWMRGRMQKYMADLLETRRRLAAGDDERTLADALAALDASYRPMQDI